MAVKTTNKPIKIRAVFPLFPPIRLDSVRQINLYKAFVEYFHVPRKIKIRGSFAHDGEELIARTLPCKPAFQNILLARNRFQLKTQHVLEFTGSFKFPGTSKYFFTDHNDRVIPESENKLRSAWRDLLPSHLDLTVQTYLRALNIAFPGAVHPTGNIWYYGKAEHAHSNYYVSPIHWSLEYLSENNLNPLTTLEVSEVIEWVFSQGGTIEGYSNSPAAKALNFFLLDCSFLNFEMMSCTTQYGRLQALRLYSSRAADLPEANLKRNCRPFLGLPII